jgi:Sel1 repeat
LRLWPAINYKEAGATANVYQPRSLGSDLHDPGKALPAPSYSDHLSALQKMAEQGDATAQFMLGVRYATGDDVKQDYIEAARWFSRAAEQGHTTAQSILCSYYWQGRGVPQDLEKAYFWSLVAQAAGDQPSKVRATLLASRINPSQLAAIKELSQGENAPKSFYIQKLTSICIRGLIGGPQTGRSGAQLAILITMCKYANGL